VFSRFLASGLLALPRPANLNNCFTCHRRLEKQDFVFSYVDMKSAK